jgi:hypothetical protein
VYTCSSVVRLSVESVRNPPNLFVGRKARPCSREPLGLLGSLRALATQRLGQITLLGLDGIRRRERKGKAYLRRLGRAPGTADGPPASRSGSYIARRIRWAQVHRRGDAEPLQGDRRAAMPGWDGGLRELNGSLITSTCRSPCLLTLIFPCS